MWKIFVKESTNECEEVRSTCIIYMYFFHEKQQTTKTSYPEVRVTRMTIEKHKLILSNTDSVGLPSSLPNLRVNLNYSFGSGIFSSGRVATERNAPITGKRQRWDIVRGKSILGVLHSLWNRSRPQKIVYYLFILLFLINTLQNIFWSRLFFFFFNIIATSYN